MTLVYGDGQPSAPQNAISVPVEVAVRQALAAYLACVEFTVHPGEAPYGDLTRPRCFRLEQVLSDFPGPRDALKYPSASVAEGGAVMHRGGFTPSILEDSYDPSSETVLWSLGVAEGTLQVDFWADSVPTREAIAAELAAVLSPNEGMSGMYLRLPPTYACAVARFTLVSMQAVDPPEAVWANERRLQVSVRYEAPVLHRRRAVPFRPSVRTEAT